MHKHKKSVARVKPGRVDDLTGDVASLIKDRCFFPDQVRFWTIQPLDKRLLHRVGEHCLGRFHLWRPDEKNRYWMRQRGLRYCYHLNQPTPKALKILSRAMSPPDKYEWHDYLINYIEFAVELVVDNWDDWYQLSNFVERCISQPWQSSKSNNRSITVDGETLYTKRGYHRNCIVAYSDRPSKITGQLCTKIEWKARGARACRDKGIDTWNDLLRFDHRRFWSKRLRLEYVDTAKLVRDCGDRRLAFRLLNVAAAHNRSSTQDHAVQDIRNGWRELRFGRQNPLSRYLVRIPAAALLSE